MFGSIVSQAQRPMQDVHAPQGMDFATAMEQYHAKVPGYVMALRNNPEISLEEMNLRSSTAVNMPRLRGTSFCVLGAGGIGTWVVRALAGLGAQAIAVVDDDSVEIHNVGPQSYSLPSLGKPKVRALQEEILATYGVKINAVQERIVSYTNLLESIKFQPDVFITAVDKMVIRNHLAVLLDGLYPGGLGARPKVYIDLRMSMGSWVAYAFPLRAMCTYEGGQSAIEYYQKNAMFKDEEGVQEACTERAIIYTGMNIASYTAALVHWLNDTPLNSAEKLRPFFDMASKCPFKFLKAFDAREWAECGTNSAVLRAMEKVSQLSGELHSVELERLRLTRVVEETKAQMLTSMKAGWVHEFFLGGTNYYNPNMFPGRLQEGHAVFSKQFGVGKVTEFDLVTLHGGGGPKVGDPIIVEFTVEVPTSSDDNPMELTYRLRNGILERYDDHLDKYVADGDLLYCWTTDPLPLEIIVPASDLMAVFSRAQFSEPMLHKVGLSPAVCYPVVGVVDRMLVIRAEGSDCALPQWLFSGGGLVIRDDDLLEPVGENGVHGYALPLLTERNLPPNTWGEVLLSENLEAPWLTETTIQSLQGRWVDVYGYSPPPPIAGHQPEDPIKGVLLVTVPTLGGGVHAKVPADQVVYRVSEYLKEKFRRELLSNFTTLEDHQEANLVYTDIRSAGIPVSRSEMADSKPEDSRVLQGLLSLLRLGHTITHENVFTQTLGVFDPSSTSSGIRLSPQAEQGPDLRDDVWDDGTSLVEGDRVAFFGEPHAVTGHWTPSEADQPGSVDVLLGSYEWSPGEFIYPGSLIYLRSHSGQHLVSEIRQGREPYMVTSGGECINIPDIQAVMSPVVASAIRGGVLDVPAHTLQI